jgi:pterin-4a-carbinolamine dehydratase
MAFANRVADAAQAANHDPDILVHGWNEVRLSLTNQGRVDRHRLRAGSEVDEAG